MERASGISKPEEPILQIKQTDKTEQTGQTIKKMHTSKVCKQTKLRHRWGVQHPVRHSFSSSPL